jgi:hypothetical protein
MSRLKARNTNHAYFRAAERCGWDKKKAEQMMRYASKNGKAPYSLPPGPERDYLIRKQQCTHRRIKLYLGYVFVFASTSTKCFTVYPMPEEEKIYEAFNIND